MLSGGTRRVCASPRLFQRAARASRYIGNRRGFAAEAVAEAPTTPTEHKIPAPERRWRPPPHPDIGTVQHGFTLHRVKDVPELELQALHYTHNKTGGEYLHLRKDDPNNVFSIGFKTNPPDRTGVPHILEHITLCGSEKYPVRDPFFKMMPRSLNNFMNAMTYPDHTVYPFATTNHQDFRNLMGIYLDAAFHPLLREHDFAQEGWRLAPLDSAAPVSEENPLVFKGVVYNEMKGNMSSADYLFRQRWQDHIFPSLNDSGGDPQKMTDLTHGQLTDFHAQHYNPSNSSILTYGNMDVQEHLEQINQEFSQHIQENVNQELKEPISLADGPQTATTKGPVDSLYPRHEQYKASFSWIMGDTADVVENFGLGIISSVLLEGFTSPLYQNTIGVGWGASFSPNTGYDSSAKTGMFTVGLNGLKRQDVGRVRDGLDNTLRYIRTLGFNKEKVEGRLNQIELSLKHKTADFGMGIVSRLQDGWFNGTDPMSAVAPEEILKAFRAKYEEPKYLEKLFAKYWLNNKTFTFIMEPQESFNDEAEAEEVTRLQRKVNEFNSQHSSEAEANETLEKSEVDLVTAQESGSDEDLSSLPSIRVTDIPRQGPRKEVRFNSLNTPSMTANVQWRETLTNGLTYFRAIQPLQNLPDDLRIYLPLFSMAIQRIGTKRFSLETLEDSLRYYTGGISMSHHAIASPFDITTSTEGIAFSGMALDRNVHHMYNLLGMSVLETDFMRNGSQEKLGELIKSSASTAINDVSDSGHGYARRFAEAGISPQGRLNEEAEGLTQVRLIMDLASRPASVGYEDIAQKLTQIQDFVLSGSSDMRAAVTCGTEAVDANEKALQSFLERLPKRGKPAPQDNDQMPYPKNAKTHFPLPYQVYYSALSTTTVPYIHADSAPLAVLAQIMTHKYIHPEIREKGGAYGGSASANSLKGTFGFSSYRDPDAQRSLGVMRKAGQWASDKEFSPNDLDEAKLSVFQSIDAPESVDDEGMTQFLTGITPEMQQERRERLLDVSPAQVSEVADKYLNDISADGENSKQSSNEVVLGAEQPWLSSKQGWTAMPLGKEDKSIEEGKEDGEGAYITL